MLFWEPCVPRDGRAHVLVDGHHSLFCGCQPVDVETVNPVGVQLEMHRAAHRPTDPRAAACRTS